MSTVFSRQIRKVFWRGVQAALLCVALCFVVCRLTGASLFQSLVAALCVLVSCSAVVIVCAQVLSHVTRHFDSRKEARRRQNADSSIEAQAIFSALEDAAVAFDIHHYVKYYNQGFLDFLGIKDSASILGVSWEEMVTRGALGTGQASYRHVSNLLHKDDYSEILITCFVGGVDRIYRARKRKIADSIGSVCAVILLLHDITEKLPPARHQELLVLLKLEQKQLL